MQGESRYWINSFVIRAIVIRVMGLRAFHIPQKIDTVGGVTLVTPVAVYKHHNNTIRLTIQYKAALNTIFYYIISCQSSLYFLIPLYCIVL